MENPEVSQASAYMLEAATNAVKEVSQLGVDSDAANGQVAFDTVTYVSGRKAQREQERAENSLPTYSGKPQQAAVAERAISGVSDGATATNPRTGQKLVYRGGQWQPM